MTLADFVRDRDQRETELGVVNRDIETPVYKMLVSMFNEQLVEIRENKVPAAGPADTVILREEADGEQMAVSSLDDLRDTVLLVNSDIYTTGARGLEDIDTPDVLTQLDEIPFTVTGYPDTGIEKMLMIEMSRYIEACAWKRGTGTLHSGFQYLSRLENERGTRRVYRRLGTETEVGTQVYGVPDARPSLPNMTVNGEDCQELRRTWFVVYDSNTGEDAALVALETAPNTWEGYWTYSEEHVSEVATYLGDAYGH
jgi:hypothetical protein